jgi:bifunctional UDP-N-acetylglucosamine pyrophosphorylase/glucosamine-1-phosphate N-acetyltransferase
MMHMKNLQNKLEKDSSQKKIGVSDNKGKQELTAIVLAGGKGTRMQSSLPKVLHPVAGRPMISRVIHSAQKADFKEIRVVVGFGAQLVTQILQEMPVSIHIQAQQLGTADAVKSADIETLRGTVVILNGDHPLIEGEDLQVLAREFRESRADLAVVTTLLNQPKEFGRIVRSMGELRAIVEAKDASADTLRIKEINTGIYFAKSEVLKKYLPLITNNNIKGEFYLTDLVSLCVEDSLTVKTLSAPKRVAFGVNSQSELARATHLVFRRNARKLLASGVILIDPKSVFIEDTVEVGAGSVLYPNTCLRGQTRIGAFSAIEPNCYLMDVQVGDSVLVRANTYLENCIIKNKASVGPFARIRPGTEIGEEAHVGNFVEMKKVKFADRAKAGHLTYLGDAEVGEDTNIGCGTITCNYAVNRSKYKTKIGKNVFVGSDSQFIAPVTIGDNAVIASGSTITENVPERALAIARSRQVTKPEYNKDIHEDSAINLSNSHSQTKSSSE